MKLRTTDAQTLPNFQGMYSTRQLRHVIESIDYAVKEFGSVPPSLKYIGTVKLDGTNGTLSLNVRTREIYVLSKETYLVDGVDNNGFRQHIENNFASVQAIMEQAEALGEKWGKYLGMEYDYVQVYGEWCGQGIVKGVALRELPRQFVIFGIKLVRAGASEQESMMGKLPPGMASQLQDPHKVFKNIYDYPVKHIELPFSDTSALEAAVALIESWTEAAAEECPFAKAHGVSGTGEGWVWSVDADMSDDSLKPYTSIRYCFKTKGVLHRTVKTKQKIEVKTEKTSDITRFAEMVVTSARAAQGIRIVKSRHQLEETAVLDNTLRTEVVAWVVEDALKEEADRLPPNSDLAQVKKALTAASYKAVRALM